MKSIKIYGISILLIIGVILSGCSNFDDLNTNPDSTTQVNAELLCNGVILGGIKSNLSAKDYLRTNALSKYIGFASELQMDEQYSGIGSGSFARMTVLPNIDKMLQYANEKNTPQEVSSYNGVASMIRSVIFYKLTMEMGDVPYTEAGKGEGGNFKAKFDTQESIFINILADLKKADEFFKNGAKFKGDPTIYAGDPAKWRMAVNAFRLKILLTLSKKTDVPSLNIKAQFKEVFDAGVLMTKTDDFFGMLYSSETKHPFNGTSDLHRDKAILTTLFINHLKSLNDRRMYYFCEPSLVKLKEGVAPTNPDAYVGVVVDMVYEDMNKGHANGEYSLISIRYRLENAPDPQIELGYAEQQMIIAEAILLGWVTGDAEHYYKTGTTSALEVVMDTDEKYAQVPITKDYINSYFTGEAAFKTNKEDQLKQIWLQKYIANFMQNSLTSYFEYRRIGYPVFPINPATSQNKNATDKIPSRWLYPSSETNYNRENLIEALNRQYEGYDEINKTMWLLK